MQKFVKIIPNTNYLKNYSYTGWKEISREMVQTQTKISGLLYNPDLNYNPHPVVSCLNPRAYHHLFVYKKTPYWNWLAKMVTHWPSSPNSWYMMTSTCGIYILSMYTNSTFHLWSHMHPTVEFSMWFEPLSWIPYCDRWLCHKPHSCKLLASVTADDTYALLLHTPYGRYRITGLFLLAIWEYIVYMHAYAIWHFSHRRPCGG